MRKPLRNKRTAKERIVKTETVGAPTGGWNARDPIANMPVKDAIYSKNWIPRTGFVETRKGCIDWKTGITGTVQSLFNYASLTGQSKRYAANGSGIYDITGNGTVGAPVIAVTNARFQYVQVTTSGGQFLSLVNGADDLISFDGTTWQFLNDLSTPAVTGIETNKLINVSLFKRRQFFVEKNSMSLWYLPVDSIAGVLTELPLGALFKKGGFIVATESWTIDAGEGLDDYFVIYTSEGEIAIYRGTDPSSSATWAERGLYYIGEALGYRSLIKMGGDIIVLSSKGVFPLSKALQSSIVNYKVAISDKIQNAYSDAVKLYGSNLGWEALVFPLESLFIVNVPTINLTQSEQYVMNTVTGAWCSFTGWNALCWMLSDGEIYFGADGKVVKAYSGTADFAAQIVSDCKTAYNYFESTILNKQWTLCRPTMSAKGTVNTQISMEVDFENNLLSQGPSIVNSSDAQWDSGIWDTSVWGGSDQISKDWTTPNTQVGYCAATRIKIASLTTQTKWIATDYAYQEGGVL